MRAQPLNRDHVVLPSAASSLRCSLMCSIFYTQGDNAEEQFTFQYGPPKGGPGFREQLANFLSEEYGDTVDR